MRRYFKIFIFFQISLFLFSCQKKSNEKIVVGISQCSEDLWRTTMNDELRRETALYQDMNIELIIKTVRDNTSEQIKDIQSFIDQKVDVLVVSPNESKTITPIVKKAFDLGIPVILVDRKIETEDYTAYVGADNYQIGKEAGYYIVNLLNQKGNIVEIRGWEGSTSDRERHNGFVDVLKNYPNIHIVAEKRGNFLESEAEKQMSNILNQDFQIDLVFALNDPMALGVYKAFLNYSGKSPYIVGIDALPGQRGGIEYIEKGLIDASFIYPTGGDKVVDLVYKILKGEKYNKENILYTAVVDKSNVRIIRLQTEQIVEHQTKIEKMNMALNQSLSRYSNQQTLFYGAIFILILITFLLLVIYLAYKSKVRVNKQLQTSNKEVQDQARTLREQKEQLISLSQELEEATQAKLVFFTNISHELKTPLTLMLGPVDSLLSSDNLTVEQKELLNLIRRNSERLSKLIIQIIEFRSYENGKMHLHLSKANLGVFLEQLSFPFYDFANRKNVTFCFTKEDTDLTICFDKEKIENIYFNLLSNAFKYTNINGQIEVKLIKETVESEEKIKLIVFNTGKVIPKDQIKNIFKRFYKVNPHDVGSGIGLALTSALVELHNGTIDVESSQEMGTTFTVTIPFTQNQVEDEFAETDYYKHLNFECVDIDTPITHNESEDLDYNKPTILVVEDNVDVRSYIRNVLKNDYRIIESSDGESGIKTAIEYSPDVIISDIMMPYKDGFEVCHTLKENLSTSHIPIILLTACNLDEQRSMGFESGADAYIPKPFNANLLKIRIRKLIENRQKIKEAFNHNFIQDSKKILLEQQEQAFIDLFEEYIKAHISNSGLNVDDVALYIGLSKSQLYRKIKSLTNYSPNELIKIIRLKQAKMLLSTSNKSISEIAYESGFSSPSYFTKCFKEFYNESPTNFLDRYEK